MELAEAVNIVTGISYKPGWSFSIGHADFGESAWLELCITARDSDKVFAPRYERITTLRPIFYIELDKVETRADLYAWVFRAIAWMEMHDAREFFGAEGARYHKPLHPHTACGKAEWRARREFMNAAMNEYLDS